MEIPREGEAVVIKFFRIATVARLSMPSQTLRNFVDSIHVDHRRRRRRICWQWQPCRSIHLCFGVLGTANDLGICNDVVSFRRRGFNFTSLEDGSTPLTRVGRTQLGGTIRVGLFLPGQSDSVYEVWSVA